MPPKFRAGYARRPWGAVDSDGNPGKPVIDRTAGRLGRRLHSEEWAHRHNEYQHGRADDSVHMVSLWGGTTNRNLHSSVGDRDPGQADTLVA